MGILPRKLSLARLREGAGPEPLLLKLVPCMVDTMMVTNEGVVHYARNTLYTPKMLKKHTPRLNVRNGSVMALQSLSNATMARMSNPLAKKRLPLLIISRKKTLSKRRPKR